MKTNSKLSDHEQVIEFIKKCDHPLKEVMEAARDTILSAHQDITEHIKWNAPSFCYQGEDRVTFNLHNHAYILLVFHRGAKVKDRDGGSPIFRDETGLLEWVTSDRANVNLYSLQDVKVKEDLLRKAVNQWITLTAG